MSKKDYKSTPESEARILILIERFTTKKNCMEGRTKLAKLDFFLRYPGYMEKAVKIRDKNASFKAPKEEVSNIENRMVRYKYGPWDPSYYAVLGSLIGRGLVSPVSTKKGLGYETTEKGSEVVESLKRSIEWEEVDERTKILKRYLNRTGSFLKDFVYENFPEVTNAEWGEEI